MKTFTIGNEEYTVIDYVTEIQEGKLVFVIDEGFLKGEAFHLTNMEMDPEVEGQMNYDIHCTCKVEDIKPIVDNIIIHILYEQMVKDREPGWLENGFKADPETITQIIDGSV